MAERVPATDRTELLADVAEMYFLEGQNQEEIAKSVGVTRSMVSRMLSEARRLGIVQIRICRPLQFEDELEAALIESFGLHDAFVWKRKDLDEGHLLRGLGAAGAHALKGLIRPHMILGVDWGTAVNATVEALEFEAPVPIRVVQLSGALGARSLGYDPYAVARRLAHKLGGESFHLNAPFLVESEETARALLADRSLSEAIALGKQCQMTLLGVGSADPQYSTLYIAGYCSLETLEALLSAGAVGQVCGWHFDVDGRLLDVEFHRRLIAIAKDDLLAIPIRMGVAGGAGKVLPLLGALRGGFINVPVTDSITAREILRLHRSGAKGEARHDLDIA